MVEVLATGNNDIGLKMPGFQIVALIVFPKVRAIRNVMGGMDFPELLDFFFM